MKRNLICLLIITVFLSLFSGCFLYDNAVGNNISPFIDPMNNDSDIFLPDANADKVILLEVEEPAPPPEETDEDEDDGIVVLSENSIRQTKPPIIEINDAGQLIYFYEGDGFIFQIPFLWRTTMEVDIIWETDDEQEIVYYVFYYVPGNQTITPVERAEVITVRKVSYYYYTRHGHGQGGFSATGTVESSSLPVYTFYAPDESQKLSSDFPNLEDYGIIIKVLTTNWNFKITE
ncbi:MAG: hypothetical protein FWG21_00710 [Oscillospiraceae bacterium]|nr:hypothetical protein [Oscillospiraceae bacterium]